MYCREEAMMGKHWPYLSPVRRKRLDKEREVSSVNSQPEKKFLFWEGEIWYGQSSDR
jgi:hypothetical protein